MPSRTDSNNVTSSDVAPANLVLLLVEDDLLSRDMLLIKLKHIFTHVEVAADGAKGLQLFRDQAPDIILSDQIMPCLSGLDMFRKIRAIDQNIPLILMTSFMDNDILLEAINLGVNRFIPKPFNHEVLVRVLTELKLEVSGKRYMEQCRLQEITLLRYRDQYNAMQQEAARRKERHVARHDLRNKVIYGADGIRWGITVTHTPRDILCGDGYTIRNLPDGRQLVFMVDAMGSGLSASLSALLATSFCNYLVDHATVSLKTLITGFQEYLNGILMEDEVLSCGFFLVDLMSRKLEMAVCGLPPLLVRTLDGLVRRVPGANPPLHGCSGSIEITTLSLSDIADVMVMTDGITDASLSESSTYRDRLENDFQASPTLAALLRRFRLHTVRGEQDDLTLLQLQRLDLPAAWNWRQEFEETGQRTGTIHGLLEALAGEIDLKREERSELEILLNEALTNDLAQGRLKAPGMLSASLWQGALSPLLTLELTDIWPGLDQFRNASEGSVLDNIRHHCDCAYIQDPGSRLLLLKTIVGGADYAH
ncbi:MAG: hypothetical protein A2076_01950 [Geobacteraceae bacterium GWC2_53_11]|nr:MAG: hypothetical protein A2076_01950 [Geobacteraceae bacterium GWC2_53_11]